MHEQERPLLARPSADVQTDARSRLYQRILGNHLHNDHDSRAVWQSSPYAFLAVRVLRFPRSDASATANDGRPGRDFLPTDG